MSHVYESAFYHFVWATWNREPLLTGDVESHARELIADQCRLLNCEIHALGGIADHVHLLVTLPGTLCRAEFVKTVKGATARLLNHTHGGPAWSFKWQGGYSVHTVSRAHVRAVTRYIVNQKQHHLEGRLWPEAELSSPVDDARE